MSARGIAYQLVARHGGDLYLTNLKLNKLVYYCQAESIQSGDGRLFDDPIQAWQYGPVIPDVYRDYRRFGRNRIDLAAIPFSLEASEKDKAYVDRVAELYGPLTAFELVDFSHRPDGAWGQAYDPNRDVEITEDAIRDSRDGIERPDMKRTQRAGIRTVDSRFPNAMRLLQDS